ncbi:DEAD/DEAH box helicase [Aestuariimicrobium kwangyangense]|uniref:DEAD/DEAH box helicase n=1 Tax=Aestuariimicrobium kwangyangense TaxID=396389 RepID=UPI0003B2E479|nr:DEAD/DEAH box helicase [Aestuariimicrobium kwangyangense]
MHTFSDFALPSAIVSELTRQGLTTPFPIQAASLPDSVAGKDVLGRGRTGSGKTLAFALPIVTRLAGAPASQSRRPRALVLCPTRELANQINATIEPLAKAVGLTATTIFGGVGPARQISALRSGVDIVIACPGRLEDLLGQRALTLDGIEITVLDEADHMADLGFLPGVKRIMDKTPQRGQRLLFSATLDNGVDQLVKRYLHAPVTHSVDSAQSPVAAMTHHFFVVGDLDAKRDIVHELASGTARRVLFTRTKHTAKKLAKQLTASGVPAVDLHGNLSQNARERNLAAFSSGEVKVLVATDIAARGIHVDDVDLVVHVDPPAEDKAYLHRSGRTARAGHSGTVVTLALAEQRDEVRQLMRRAKITAAPVHVAVGHAAVNDLIGVRAAHVRPAPVAPVATAARGAQSPRGGQSSRGGQSTRGGQSARGTQSAQNSRNGQSSRSSQPARSGQGGRGQRVTTGTGGSAADASRSFRPRRSSSSR